MRRSHSRTRHVAGTLISEFNPHAGARKMYGAVVRCAGRIHGSVVFGGYRSSGGLGGAAQYIPHAGDDDEIHVSDGRQIRTHMLHYAPGVVVALDT